LTHNHDLRPLQFDPQQVTAAGDPILSPAVTRRLMRRAVVQENAKDLALRQLAGLSPREREVVEAIAEGQANAEIAASLLMSVPKSSPAKPRTASRPVNQAIEVNTTSPPSSRRSS
jgi:DNA-directed RNA polymerase specialized sigma24 family protein